MSWTVGSSTIAGLLCLQHLRGGRLEWAPTIILRVLAVVMAMVATTGTVDAIPTRLMVVIATPQATAEDPLGLGTEIVTAIGIVTRLPILGCRLGHPLLRMAGTTGPAIVIIAIAAPDAARPWPGPTSTRTFRATG